MLETRTVAFSFFCDLSGGGMRFCGPAAKLLPFDLALSYADFLKVFQCTKEEFATMPPWRRTMLKKKVDLF